MLAPRLRLVPTVSVPTALLCLWSLLAFTLTPSAAWGGDLDGVRTRGTLRMVCWPHPDSLFIHRTEGGGAPGIAGFSGIDFELMRGFAAELGVELEVVPARVSFAQMFSDLQTGLGDLAASSLTITPARQALFDFSKPYFLEHMVVVTRKGADIDDESDLAHFRGAVVEGSSHDQRLRQLVPKENLTFVDITTDALRRVEDGSVDFALVDSGTFNIATFKNTAMASRLVVALRFADEEAYGIAVRKGSDLLPPLDAYLERLQGSGELDRLIQRYSDRSAGAPG